MGRFSVITATWLVALLPPLLGVCFVGVMVISYSVCILCVLVPSRISCAMVTVDSGAAVVVLTPGRLIDMVRMRACSLGNVSFVVLDEADRMIEAMGFGPQVRTILSQVRPDAQKIFASATFAKSIQQLASAFLPPEALRVVASSQQPQNQAHGMGKQNNPTSAAHAAASALVSDNVTEFYVTLPSEKSRYMWLASHINGMLAEGLVIVFCSTRGGAAELANRLRSDKYATACIHGETDMADRAGLMRMFRARDLNLLVATDIAARGLDIGGVRVIVSYEPAKNWDDHVHRSGRTGRAGEKGKAYTLLVPSSSRDSSFARSAVSALTSARASIPEALSDVAGMAVGHGGKNLQRGSIRRRGFANKHGRGQGPRSGGAGRRADERDLPNHGRRDLPH